MVELLTKLAYKPLAKKDLKNIWQYSFEQWGKKQANNYLHEIHNQALKLAKNPNQGGKCDYIKSGYRKKIKGQHIIFYLPIKNGIDIIRILHQKINIDKYLK